MPERGFDTSFWSDPFVQKLPKDGKMLFSYLKTNEHCNPSGLYRITPATIAFETKLAESDIPELLKVLRDNVVWYPEENLVWVKDFIKEQTKSPKFLAAAAKCLTSISNNGAIQVLLDYNLRRYSIPIPYQYYKDRVSILTRASASISVSSSGSSAGEGDEVKGKGELGISKREEEPNKETESATGKDTSRSRMEAEETLCEGDRGEVAPKGAGDSHRAEGDGAVISVWRSVKGWRLTPADASALVASLRTEFPDVDILEQSKVWAARKLSEPLKQGSKPSQQIWNFMRLARKFAAEREDSGQKGARRVEGSRKLEDFKGKW